MKGKVYVGQAVDVYYDVSLCVHAAECVRRLPDVFDTKRKPWIDPDGADAPDVATVIERCPSGALQYVRKDAGPNETPDVPTSVRLNDWQQIEVRGDLLIDVSGGRFRPIGPRSVDVGSLDRPVCDKQARAGHEHLAPFRMERDEMDAPSHFTTPRKDSSRPRSTRTTMGACQPPVDGTGILDRIAGGESSRRTSGRRPHRRTHSRIGG